jgi:HEAT repeat protein
MPVPYEKDTAELLRLLSLDLPASWPAYIALAHKPEPAALEALEESAGSQDFRRRLLAVEALGMRADGAEAAPTLVALLRDESPYVVRKACEVVGKLGVGSGHTEVVRLLQSIEPATREKAVDALAELWEEGDFERLLARFEKDPSQGVRRQAAWALYRRAGPGNSKPLFDLWHPNSLHRHRGWACELAGEYGDPSCEPVLRGLLQDPDGHVRKAAKRAIAKIEKRHKS